MGPLFSPERLDRLLAGADMEAILFCRPLSYLYFTALPWYERRHFAETPMGTVFPLAGYVRGRPHEAFAAVGSRDLADVERRGTWIRNLRGGMGYVTPENAARAILEALGNASVTRGRVGIERSLLAHDLVASLDAASSGFVFEDCTALLLDLQAIKSDEEMRRLREACALTERGMLWLAENLAEGVTPRQLLDGFYRQTAGAFVEPYGHFFPIHFADTYTANRPIMDVPLTPGTLIHADVSLGCRGLLSDVGRNLYFGTHVPSAVERLSRATNGTVDRVAASLRPGMACLEVHTLCEEIFCDLAGGLDGTGFRLFSHGIGWTLYSAPHVSLPAPRGELLPGHAFTLEVRARLPEIGHFKCEDAFVVHEDSVECLSHLDRGLVVKKRSGT